MKRAPTIGIERNSQIDILRGLAILGVIACHTIVYTDRALVNHGGSPSNYADWVISAGKYGVEVFFFVSGYLMQSLYGVDRKFSFRVFFARRLGRILPLWVAFLFIDWHLLRNFGTGGAEAIKLVRDQGQFHIFSHSIIIIILSLSFTLFLSSNLWNTVIPGGWSIQAEMFHYLVFSLTRKFRRRTILIFLASISTSTLALATFAKSVYFNSVCPTWILGVINAWIRLDIYSTLIYFFLGVTFHYLLKRGVKSFQLAHFDLILSITIAVSTLALPLAFGTNIEAMGYLLAMVLLSYVVLPDSRFGKFTQRIGKFSYFIYFFEFPVLYLFFSIENGFKWHSPSNVLQIPLFIFVYIFTTFVCMFFGKFSYQYFERPLLRLAHKI